ncbi:TonB-dependent receptor [Neptunicella marina]|uniref:TonB-dependent receptor n=1 Tax=Neptunicella marina TaxID=2125989 RepID=A0A8J6IS02_9ALTE|nr:TonB-dependent receptor [Neptunicella marina]MBC3764652.1 TonB-dependent receptor [Neptunicella marina]
MSKPIFTQSVCAIAVAAALASPLALAQQQSQEENQKKGLERIEVTARKTAESIQEVPVAVTSVGEVELAEKGISSVVEIQQMSPNTTLQKSRGTNSTLTAFIRGVGQEDPLWGYEPGVGIYVDDVYMARPQGAVLDILNVERIEVLRGPQGTLYGKNTIGGAVKYVTKTMSGDTELAVKGTVGSYGQKDIKLSGQLPLVQDKLYFGFAYANLNRDGFGEFLTSALPNQDKENYNKDLQAYRLTLEYHASDDVFMRLNYDNTEDKSNSKGGYRLLPSLLTDAPVPDSKYDSYTSLPTWNKVENEGVSLTINWDVNDNFLFKSITSKRESYSPTNIDFDNTSLRIFDVPAIYDDEQFTQEFQLNYVDDGIKVVSGLYYFKGDSCGQYDAILDVLGNALGFDGYTSEVGGCSNSKSIAAYVQGSFDLTDKLSLTAGARYTKEEKDATVYNGVYFGTMYPQSGWVDGFVRDQALVDATNHVVLDNNADWSRFTPKLGVEYQYSPDMMLYASYAQGFKSGAFNPRATTDEPAADPEIVDSFEVGMKSDWNDTVRFNATLFMLDHKDRQYVTLIPDPDDLTINNQRLGNVGKSEATGAEVELTVLATDDLEWYANLGYIDAKFSEVKSVTPDGQPLDITDQFSITNTPKTTASLGFNYNFSSEMGDFVWNTNYYYRSKYSLVEKGNLLTQEGYGLVNMSLNWYSEDGQWSVGLHGKNLTDKEYLVGNYPFVNVAAPYSTDNPGPGTGGDTTLIGYYGDPRTVSLTVGYRF